MNYRLPDEDVDRALSVALRSPPAVLAPAPPSPRTEPPPPQDEGQLVVDVTGGQRAATADRRARHADAAGGGDRRRQHRRARPPGRRDRRLRPAQSRPVHAARAGRRCTPSPSPQVTAPDFAYLRDHRRRRISSRASSRPMATARSPSAAISTTSPPQSELTRQGYVVAAARLAPRRAPLRRHHLFAADRRGRLFRHAHRLCLGDRARRGGGSSASRSWIMTAPTTAS